MGHHLADMMEHNLEYLMELYWEVMMVTHLEGTLVFHNILAHHNMGLENILLFLIDLAGGHTRMHVFYHTLQMLHFRNKILYHSHSHNIDRKTSTRHLLSLHIYPIYFHSTLSYRILFHIIRMQATLHIILQNHYGSMHLL